MSARRRSDRRDGPRDRSPFTGRRARLILPLVRPLVPAAVSRLAVAALASSVGLAAPVAAAARPTTAQLADEGLDDPRARTLPRRHRLRIGLLSDWVRGSKACTGGGRCERFHFAPLMIEIGYQAQILRRFMIRPSIAFGGNVANTRNAMPLVLQQNIFAGYQGALLGAAAGYSHILPFPTTINATDGHMGLAQPGFVANHVVSGELSLTTRFADRSSLFFAVRLGGMKTHLMHLDIDKHRWFFILGFNAGWYIDLGRGRRRRPQTP